MLHDGGKDPFGFEMFKYTRSTEESKKLNNLHRPAIIISASGMAQGGRVLTPPAPQYRRSKIDGYSAHTDEGELPDFIADIPNKPGRVSVVHGENQAAEAMGRFSI